MRTDANNERAGSQTPTERNPTRVRVDNYTRACLTLIAGLMTLLIVALWAEKVPDGQSALASNRETFVKDASRSQLVALVKAQDETTEKLEELIGVLTSGDVRVEVINAPRREGADEGTTAPTE